MSYPPVNETPTPMTTELSKDVALDPARQESAREYARIRRRLLVVDLAVTAVLVIGFLATRASRWLGEGLLGVGLTDPGLMVGAYVALVFAGYTLVSSPLAWHSGYALPHRYSLSTQTPRGWLADRLKSVGLGLGPDFYRYLCCVVSFYC